MSELKVGQSIMERCTSCYHNVLKVIKVVPKEFEDKTAYVIWTQCPQCGNNDHQLTQKDE